MANKIFQLKNGPLGENYIHPKSIDPNKTIDVIFLGTTETHAYFSFNPEDVEITEGQGDLDVRILDKADADDKATLDLILKNSQAIKNDLLNIEQSILSKYTLVELLISITSNNKTITDEIKEIQTKKEEHLTKLGF
jgi:hypothetical protein